MFFNIMHFCYQTTFTITMYNKSSCLEQIMGNSPENIDFET